MKTMLRLFLLLLAAFWLASLQAHASPCLVLGETNAKVKAVEGERSPVFMTTSCESLRLISGNAQASWVGKDGKPHLSTIASAGPESTPDAGVAERSVHVVWAELTSKRETQRPAYMRALSKERDPRVFVPADGLLLLPVADADTDVRLALLKGEKEEAVSQFQVKAGKPLRIGAEQLTPGEVYRIRIQRGEMSEQWRWRILPAEEARLVQQRLTELASAPLAADQKQMVQAMLFEQLQLRVNREMALQGLR